MREATTVPTDTVPPHTTIPYEPRGSGVPHPVVETEYGYHRPREVTAGSRLGRYVIDGELGVGGMGMVFSAMDVKLGRRAAIKVVRGRPHNGRLLGRGPERLLREAQALARIRHPNIVSLYDVGEAGGGLYVAMEELHGVSLRVWLDAQRRGWREVVSVFLQAGRGLAAAHRAGIMHRDFKPNNVHIGDDGRVVVLDFGLALATSNEQPDSEDMAEIILHNRLTDVGIILGTTGYLAPEQLLHREAGAASDQFAFCVGLYEALFGVCPYPGDTALAVAKAFRNGKLTPPGRNHVPRRIRAAVERGLAIEPGDRWPSMDALVAELDRDPHERLRSVSRTAALVAAAWAGAHGLMWVQGTMTAHATSPTCPPSAVADPSPDPRL